jgi:tRNA(Ile)-lysidine synthase
MVSKLIQVQGKLPREVYIACSGGVDSMAVVNFLMNNHKVNLLFFDHDTETSASAKQFLQDYFEFKDVVLHIGNISRERQKNESKEEFWRNERYKYFNQFTDAPVITCHHLDDCVETWIWSSLHGEGKLIPYHNKNVMRPFRLNRKMEFENWCRVKHVPWIEDASNNDTKYMRNFIRHEIVPKVLVVNPGLHKVIAKKIKQGVDIHTSMN